ncbi:unnamed protein product [Calypogeia fissa]
MAHVHGIGSIEALGLQTAQGGLQKSSPRCKVAAAAGEGGRRIQCENNLSMSSSAVFRNSVRRRSGASAAVERAQSTVKEEHERGDGPSAAAPVCLFGGLFGGNRKAAGDTAPPKLQSSFKYHDDVPLPFPTSLLSNTFLAGKELRCCYKASIDGFGAMTFHKRCDFKGPCVIVGTTSKGLRIGAFNPEGYRSTDDYYDSFDAFLFYWPSQDGGTPAAVNEEFPQSSPIVLPKVGGSGAALFDFARGGPQFGADGLLIGAPLSPVMGGLSGPETDSDQAQGQLSEARSRLGLSYAKRPDGKDSLFGDDKKATLVEIEVFCSPAIAAMY